MSWVALAGVAALVGAWYRPVTVDEAWSLVVARRMLHGDRLYQDIFYGAAPLAIWIQALVFRVLRPQGIVVRCLTVAYFCGAVWAAVTLVDGGTVAMAASGAMVALGAIHLHPQNHYGLLTTVAALWAAVAVTEGHPWLAGLLAGAAVLGKYSVGVVAMACTALAAALVGSPIDGVSVVAAAVAPVVLLALVRPAQARWFLRRAVANKPGYLAAGRAAPGRWIRTRRWSKWDLVATQVPAVIAIALVVVAPIAAGWAAVTNSSDASVVGLMLTVTGVSTVFPRFDGPHALASMLFTVPGLAMAAELGRWGPWVGALAWALAAIGIAARSSLTPGRVVRRDLPGLRRLPVLPMSGNVWPDETDGLPVRVFVFRLDAALVYACGGVSNPTPFDYPASTTFGAHGQADVVDAFESGMPVCHGWTNTADPLTPSEILAGLPTEGGTPIRLGRVLRAGDEPEM